jgi:hypothetical protein
MNFHLNFIPLWIVASMFSAFVREALNLFSPA